MNTAINFGARGGNAAVIEFDTRKQNQLVRKFDEQLEVRKHNRLELGRIARDLKPLYVTSGQRKKGKGWEAFLEVRGLELRTVEQWILDYERSAGIREPKIQKSVPENLSGTNGTKGDSGAISLNGEEHRRPTFAGGGVAPDPGPPSEAGFHYRATDSDTDWPEGEPELEPAPKIDPLDSPEGRSEWLFKNALNVFERANKASGQALKEWDAAAARVRKVLASYKRDEVDNPNADFSPITVGEEE